MTPDEWLDTASTWARIWPDRPLQPESVEVWYDLLADLDGPAVRAALLQMAADPTRAGWPPRSPGELRAATEPPAADWTDAIGRLAIEIRRHGRYGGRPALDDPALDAYVDSQGGWTALCATFDPTNPTVRAQFRDHYQTVTERTRRDHVRQLAAGILPALNSGGTTDA